MTPALKAAVQAIVAEISKAEGASMSRLPSRGGDKVVELEVEPADVHAQEVASGVEGEASCPECEAGTCENPDHMSEDEMSALGA